MAFRPTMSRLINDEQSVVESSLEAVVTINGFPVGRATGVRGSIQTGARAVNELGSDRGVEIIQGIKGYQGTLQSVTIRYGDTVKRLASMAGGKIDAMSKAATLSNMPPFDLVISRRGTPGFNTPQLYADPEASQKLSGTGDVIKTFMNCVISSAEQNFNSDQAMIMESVQFIYLDEVLGAFTGKFDSTFTTGIS